MKILMSVAAALVVAAAVSLLGPASGTQGRKAGAPRVASPKAVDTAELLEDVRVLAGDSMEGRKAGTPGGARARAYLVRRFREVGLQSFGASFERPFALSAGRGAAGAAAAAPPEGANVVGYVRGRVNPARHIVLTAHYDHLGVVNGEVYNGADDNASGVAALLALAKYFALHPPANTLIFAALDAEESGLQGARAFVKSPPVAGGALALNVNLDMVGRSERGELYAAGAYHTPSLRPYLERIAGRAPVKLLLGHDRPGLPPAADWTNQSDHAAFHHERIPFVYFGVEDHGDYHRPTDDFEAITPDFFARAAETILDAVKTLDENLKAVESGRAAK